MKEEEEEESQSASGPQLPPPDVEERKRSFSDRQKILEEKKIQQQREEAERSRVEEEKRLKKDAKRRERKERERREAMRIQKLEEQNKNDFVSYYGPNFSVHPALTSKKVSSSLSSAYKRRQFVVGNLLLLLFQLLKIFTSLFLNMYLSSSSTMSRMWLQINFYAVFKSGTY